MSAHLISPPELAPPIPHDLTPTQRIALWVDLMNVCEQFLLAGLEREVGPSGDVKAAHRQWYTERMEEHDRTMRHMLEDLSRRGGAHARQ
jgi:hypothetical protein